MYCSITVHKMNEPITIRAGKKAIRIIRDEGLNLDRIKVLAGASGSAKFLVLTGIDRVLMSMFENRTAPLYLIGTSIGAFRMAAFCQKDPLKAIERLEQGYIHQSYSLNPSRSDITRESIKILDAFIDDSWTGRMLDHPFMRICILSNRCRGLLKSEHLFIQGTGLAMAASANLVNRNFLRFFFKRALFIPPGTRPPFVQMNQFPMEIHELSLSSFKRALFSSGAIPYAMEGISDIDNAPGVFRDGGIIDYHLDIPFLEPDDDGLVLYPHFYETITPGWFDKKLRRSPDPDHVQHVVLVSPSREFVAGLPGARIPDRKDFYRFKGRDQERIDCWNQAVRQSRALGEAFYDAVMSGRIKQMVKPL